MLSLLISAIYSCRATIEKIRQVLLSKLLTFVLWLRHLKAFRMNIVNQNLDVLIVYEALIGSLITVTLVNNIIPLLVSERVDPNPEVYSTHRFAKMLRPFKYKHGVICSVQMRGFAVWCKQNWGIESFITPNHFEIEIFIDKKSNLTSKLFIAAVRNHYQKAYETLLKS